MLELMDTTLLREFGQPCLPGPLIIMLQGVDVMSTLPRFVQVADSRLTWESNDQHVKRHVAPEHDRDGQR